MCTGVVDVNKIVNMLKNCNSCPSDERTRAMRDTFAQPHRCPYKMGTTVVNSDGLVNLCLFVLLSSKQI